MFRLQLRSSSLDNIKQTILLWAERASSLKQGHPCLLHHRRRARETIMQQRYRLRARGRVASDRQGKQGRCRERIRSRCRMQALNRDYLLVQLIMKVKELLAPMPNNNSSNKSNLLYETMILVYYYANAGSAACPHHVMDLQNTTN